MRKYIVCLFIFLLSSSSAGASQGIVFSGEVDLKEQILEIALQPNQTVHNLGSLVIKLHRLDPSQYKVNIDIDNLQTPTLRLSSLVESHLFWKEDPETGESYVDGRLSGELSTINGKPVRDLRGSFSVKDDLLTLQNIDFANIQCNGRVDLAESYDMDLDFRLVGMPMETFLSFWMKEIKHRYSGDIDGNITVSGKPDQMFVKGSLVSENGNLKKMKFDNIELSAEGVYPHVQIANSMLSKSSGMSYTFEGPVDFSDAKNMKTQIEALKFSPMVSQSDDESVWTIKSVEYGDNDKLELKYLLRDRPEIGASQEEVDMFGLQRTLEF